MEKDDPQKPVIGHYTCNCPFCGSEYSIQTAKNYVYCQPLQFRSYSFLHGIFLWNNRLPADVEQLELICKNDGCKKKFYIQCWSHDPFHKTRKNNPVTNEKLFLEEMIDRAQKPIRNLFNCVPGVHVRGDSLRDMLILNGYLVGILFLVLMVAPAVLSGAGDKLFRDSYVIVTPILFVLLLTSFQRQIRIIHRSLLVFNSLPVLLPENYRVRTDYHPFNNASIRRFFFGHHCKNKWQKVKTPPHITFQKTFPYISIRKWTELTPPPLVFGIGAVIIGLFFYHYFIPSGGFTLWEVNTGNPIIYSSFFFNAGYLVFHIPFWFVIGTVVWLSLVTPCFIFTIARNLPLRIEPLQDIGGPEVLGDILLKSNFSIALLAVGFIAYVLRNESILKLDPSFEFFNIFLLSLFSFAIVFGFLLPLYPIHTKMRQCKEDEINHLLGQIDYQTIKECKVSQSDISLNLLRFQLISKISTKKEWPFNFETLSKIIFLTLIPLLQLCQDVYPYVKIIVPG